MDFRLPNLTRRKSLWVTILVVYSLSAWALWAVLPPRPRLSIALPEPGEPVVISRDGTTLVTKSARDKEADPVKLRVWYSRSGRLRTEIPGIRGAVWHVHASPDGSLVAAVVADHGKGAVHLHLYDVMAGCEVE